MIARVIEESILQQSHFFDDVIKWKYFPHYGHFVWLIDKEVGSHINDALIDVIGQIFFINVLPFDTTNAL